MLLILWDTWHLVMPPHINLSGKTSGSKLLLYGLRRGAHTHFFTRLYKVCNTLIPHSTLQSAHTFFYKKKKTPLSLLLQPLQ
ncbi:hypothetical protein Hanom_Chr11g00977291 [Helianthus anomalus]